MLTSSQGPRLLEVIQKLLSTWLLTKNILDPAGKSDGLGYSAHVHVKHDQHTFCITTYTFSITFPFFLLFLRSRMRTKALILIFPFAVFLTETVSFPMQINSRCKQMSCMKTMSEMNCPHKKGNCEKPAGKCNNSSACSICPVCCIFVFQPQYSWSLHKGIPKKKYHLANTGYISSYASDIWKPPNNYLQNM